MNYPKTIQNLIECFKSLPGVGEKTAERLALSLLNFDEEKINLFSTSISDIKKKVKKCKICNNLSDEDECEICKNKTSRNTDVICVVEEPKNVILFEKVGSFNGLYHVLDGLISPLDGINPEDINIGSLIKRVKENKPKEVIIALKSSIEAETTTLYIKKMLEGLDVNVTKLAQGVPIGVDMEYLDSMTLEMAFEDRKDVA